MSQYIEELENRQLLSVSAAVVADLAALKAEALAIKAQATSFVTSVVAENKALAADIKRLGNSSSNKALLNTLKKDETSGGNIGKRDSATLLSIGTRDTSKVIADLRALFSHPGNAAGEARLAGNLVTLESDASTNAATLQTAFISAETLDDADLNAISTANAGDTTTHNDVLTEEGTLAAGVATADADGVALGATVSKLLTDIATS